MLGFLSIVAAILVAIFYSLTPIETAIFAGCIYVLGKVMTYEKE